MALHKLSAVNDPASLLLRLALGGTMIAHGVRHGRTLPGTANWFKSIGFRRPRMQAGLSSGVEVGAGVAIALGAATPLAASAIVGTMAVAFRTVHQRNGFFVTAEGWEYVAFISTTAAALSALGPGRWSVDHLLGLPQPGSPVQRAAVTAVLGAAGAAIQLGVFWTKPDQVQA